MKGIDFMRNFLFAIGFTTFGYLLRGLMIAAKNEYLREDDIEEDNDDDTDEPNISKENKEEDLTEDFHDT